uniref:Uncharacterized protein n=1 Tax=Triticum urartu TaxID=4572 RepID=A0A8R7PZ13_TRIUA
MDRKGNGLVNPKKRGRDLKKYFEVFGSDKSKHLWKCQYFGTCH